ncbi:hypothetical protein BC940DRAFT_337663 [Gongronella butleri]|nr:hypothetical protein BC940DRAFT_337663 [Gongronella butleri]
MNVPPLEIPLNHLVFRNQAMDYPTGRHQPATMYTAVKCSIQSVDWDPQFLGALENYVLLVHMLTKHTLQALNPHPDMQTLVNFRNDHFIKAVFTYLADGTLSENTPRIVPGLDVLLEEYIAITQFQRVWYSGAVANLATYPTNKIKTAYLNNIQANLEDRVMYYCTA